ncbi:MAG: hypothetical protein HYX72_13500 [Acidobacteria bacterium]|nr:hypothetical protein [Acidobacteriota bacterium]
MNIWPIIRICASQKQPLLIMGYALQEQRIEEGVDVLYKGLVFVVQNLWVGRMVSEQ